MPVAFGDQPCPTCKRLGCMDHVPVEQDYPASAWDTSADYGPLQSTESDDRGEADPVSTPNSLGGSDPDMSREEVAAERRFSRVNIKPDPIKAIADEIRKR